MLIMKFDPWWIFLPPLSLSLPGARSALALAPNIGPYTFSVLRVAPLGHQNMQEQKMSLLKDEKAAKFMCSLLRISIS